MLKKENTLLGIFSAVFLFSVIMIIFDGVSMTGYATSGTTTSNVTITTYLSISMSSSLSQGILFGSIAALPVVDHNATANNDSAGGTTSFFINVSTDSNTPVDFCLKANGHLHSSGGSDLGLGNETYSNATSTSATVPLASLASLFTTTYAKAGENIGTGNSSYYRFYLDVPAATPSGSYNNSVSFEGVQTSQPC